MARRRPGPRQRAKGQGQRAGFTRAERRLIARLKTPLQVQRWLNALPYNTEPPPGPRHAAKLSRRGAPSHGALPRSGARGCGDARAAWLPAARHELRIDRRARPRDFCVSPQRPLGIGGALARPRASRPQAGVRHAARAREKLSGYIRGPDRPRDGVRPGGFAKPGWLRLAAGRHQRLEGGTDAPGRAASRASHAGGAVSIVSPALPRVQRDVSQAQAALLRRTRKVDGDTRGIPQAGASSSRAPPRSRERLTAAGANRDRNRGWVW